jgi:hypothetical protein
MYGSLGFDNGDLAFAALAGVATFSGIPEMAKFVERPDALGLFKTVQC